MCSFKLSHFLLPSGGSKQLKNEMFYNRKWFGVSIAEFMDILNRYLHWYNEQRIKMSLGGEEYLIRTKTPGLANRILRLLGIRAPRNATPATDFTLPQAE